MTRLNTIDGTTLYTWPPTAEQPRLNSVQDVDEEKEEESEVQESAVLELDASRVQASHSEAPQREESRNSQDLLPGRDFCITCTGFG